MKLYEKELEIPRVDGEQPSISVFAREVAGRSLGDEMPVRFVVTGTTPRSYRCEIGYLQAAGGEQPLEVPDLFGFRQRPFENTAAFNAVMLVPTGVGAKIGGDAGDAAPAARLLASACDTLITHPNVVNASDINEIPSNGLYVEGSTLTRFMMGSIGLERVRSNRVLLVVDEHTDPYFKDSAINSASAARASLGVNCEVVMLADGFEMGASYSRSGRAIGEITRIEKLQNLLEARRGEFDAIALSSLIKLPDGLNVDYFSEEMVNPWGGAEALLTHGVSLAFGVPSAHSPMMHDRELLNTELGVVAPQKAAEAVSITFLHCILKGLYKSPRIIVDQVALTHPQILSAEDVSCLVIPDGCIGLPVLAAIEQEIPVIAVRENANRMSNDLREYPFAPGKLLFAENYLEAVGLMAAIKEGIEPETVRRPLKMTAVKSVGGRMS